MSDLDREPIFWTSTRPGYNTKDRERVRFENGKKIVEKVPQRGHQGDYDERKPARGVRAVTVVCHDGHVVNCVLTNAAGHLDPTTPFGQYMQSKWRFHGWYPAAACPLALLANGAMRAEHFHAPSILKDRPCEQGTYDGNNRCKHSIAEEAARKKSRAAESAENEARWLGPQEKALEATKAQTAAIVDALLKADKK